MKRKHQGSGENWIEKIRHLVENSVEIQMEF